MVYEDSKQNCPATSRKRCEQDSCCSNPKVRVPSRPCKKPPLPDPGPSRADAHLRIGRLLAAHTPPEKLEEAIFEIVSQLNRVQP